MAYRPGVRSGLLAAGLTTLMMMTGAAQADTSQCAEQVRTFDWSEHGWGEGDLTNAYTHDEATVKWTVSGDVDTLKAPAGKRQSPYISDTHTGGTGSGQDALFLRSKFETANQAVEVTLDLGRAGEGVAAFDMTLFDVDLDADHVDHVTVTATLDGVVVPVTLTAGDAARVSGNSAVGVDTLGKDKSAGNVVISVTQPVDKIEISYSNALMNGDLGAQQLFLQDMRYCPARAKVNADKRIEIADGTNGRAIPGAEFEIVFKVENTGAGWVDDGSMVLIDSISPEMAFRNEIFPGASGPVVFSDNASGMTFSDATDVAYSSASAKPSNFSECDYTPQPGYDPEVRHVCISPKGALRGDSAGRGFELKFAAQYR